MTHSDIPIVFPLDADLYNNVKQDEIDFFKTQTDIQDEAQLKAHILAVQAEAYAIYPYTCIRLFLFTSNKISRYPAYESVLELVKERPEAILLDLGCCFGNDSRRVIADGFPPENVVASDLHSEFWALGHKLYKTTQETYPVTFVPGDIFDPSVLSPEVHIGLRPDLKSLTSLTPLQRHVSVIHAGFLFHLFSESHQRTLAQLLSTLLSPESGSMIIGTHTAIEDTDGQLSGSSRWTEIGTQAFAFSAAGWKDMWAGKNGIFKPDEVSVWTHTDIGRKGSVQLEEEPQANICQLTWSITRL